MASENAKIDQNYIKTLLAITDDENAEIRNLRVDPDTGRLKVSAIISNLTFLDLTDTPDDYTDAASKLVAVNAEGDGLEFITNIDTDEKVAVDSGATAGYLGAAYNDGVLRSSAPLSYTDGGDYITLGITQATTSTNGYLSSTDWNTFNGKITAVSSTDNAIVRFNGTGGAVQNSSVTIDDNGALQMPNLQWFSFKDYAGTGALNTLKATTSDTVDVGVTLNIDGLEAEEDAGAITLFDMPVSSSSADGTEMSATIRIDGNNILKVYSEANGTGGVDSFSVKILNSASLYITETAATSDTDKFLVSDSNIVKYRTGAEVKSDIDLGNVENTALSTWAGTSNITTLGTVTSGTLSTGAALADVTMSLGSDADGDIYYRSSNKLTRLAKGTASQVLTMNSGATAPEWASSSSSDTQLLTTVVTLSSADILALNSSPKTLISSPGADKVILLEQVVVYFDYGTTQYTGGSNATLYYADATNQASNNTISSTIFTGAVDFVLYSPCWTTNQDKTAGINQAVILKTTGDFADGDGTAKLYIRYGVYSK